MKITQFGGVALPLNDYHDTLGAAIRASALPYYGTDGSFDPWGDRPYPKSAMPIVVAGAIVSASIAAVDTDRDTLMACRRQGLAALYASMRDATTRYTFAKVTNLPAELMPVNLQHYPFQIAFQSLDPFWYKDEWRADGNQLFADGRALADGTFVAADSPTIATFTAARTATVTLTNNGNRRSNRLRLDAYLGGATGFTVYNAANNHQLIYSASIPASSQTIIDCAAWQAVQCQQWVALPVNVYANLTWDTYLAGAPVGQESWLALEPGANPLTITLPVAATGTLEFRHSSCWEI